jgi:succinate dehydrogenase flavin-adding protein (antitoxin of CptAB toxin-antitoxin module)
VYKENKIILSVFYDAKYKKYNNKKIKIKAKLLAGDDDFVLQPKIKTIKVI